MPENNIETRVTTRELAHRVGLSPEIVDRLVDEIMRSLEVGHEVRLSGLGILRVTEPAARELATPMIPGGVAEIPRRKVVRFRQLEEIGLRLNPDRKKRSRR